MRRHALREISVQDTSVETTGTGTRPQNSFALSLQLPAIDPLWRAMRFFLLLALLVPAIATGQDQERKLVDRLLRPDMTLQNSQQNRKFLFKGGVHSRSANTKSFYVTDRSLAKTFTGDRQFATTSFSSRKFTTKSANVEKAEPAGTYNTSRARDISSSRDANKAYASRGFSGKRPFLDQGKSQKALHAQDHPLSIDEVRELLNKNK